MGNEWLSQGEGEVWRRYCCMSLQNQDHNHTPLPAIGTSDDGLALLTRSP